MPGKDHVFFFFEFRHIYNQGNQNQYHTKIEPKKQQNNILTNEKTENSKKIYIIKNKVPEKSDTPIGKGS